MGSPAGRHRRRIRPQHHPHRPAADLPLAERTGGIGPQNGGEVIGRLRHHPAKRHSWAVEGRLVGMAGDSGAQSPGAGRRWSGRRVHARIRLAGRSRRFFDAHGRPDAADEERIIAVDEWARARADWDRAAFLP